MYKEDSIEKEEEEDGGDEQSKGFQVEPSLIMAWCNLRRHALPVCCYQNGQGWRRRCNVACIRLESRVSKGIARGRPGVQPFTVVKWVRVHNAVEEPEQKRGEQLLTTTTTPTPSRKLGPRLVAK
jgi:hypothetical protein